MGNNSISIYLRLISIMMLVGSCDKGEQLNSFSLPQYDNCLEKKALPNLSSRKEQEDFLIQLFNRDQYVRTELVAICNTNNDSYECASSKLNRLITDYNNFDLIRQYLQQFGYPRAEEFDEIAQTTPWAIIHHTVGISNTLDKELSTVLISAWRNNDLSSQRLLWYLRRKYLIDHRGEEFPNSSLPEEEEIEELMKELRLV